ncbi:MAG: gamma-glutamyltransferase [Pirellulaceae bacterium]
MKTRMHFLLLVSSLALMIAMPGTVVAQQDIQVGRSSQNMVATVHPLATHAGVAVLEAGGNAIDAAVAAGLMLTVVDGYNSGIGGGCFVLIHTADGQTIAIDGREMAPAAAHRDMYLVDGKPDTSLSQTGPLAIGVPGALKAYEQACREHGQLPFASLVYPAARMAAEGFEISDVYAGRLSATRETLMRFPGSREALLKPDGSAWEAGETLVQSDLASTLDQIRENGIEWFYEGAFARQTADWMAENGGLITADDFANYQTHAREPIRTTYRDHEIIGFPPPSSGGVHVAQILNILEHFDLAELYESDRAAFVHVVAEAMKLAFADRAHWLGDPDFADVPRGLIDKDYAAELAKKIDLSRVTAVDSHGTPPLADAEFFERHTTHIAAADKQGNWVAITTTVNTTFGSKVIVPGLGVVMNNQMDDFAIAPGVPNAFGLVGTEANSVQPGKRPLSSMSPSIILKDGQPVMTVGAAGGPRIITQVLLAIIRRIDLQMDIDEAVSGKRFHHQWSPDLLALENGFDDDLAQELELRGHRLRHSGASGITQAIVRDPQSGEFTGVHDPRTPGLAAGMTEALQPQEK